jgi:hypothetical protein
MPVCAASEANSWACTTYRRSKTRNSVGREPPSNPSVKTLRLSNGKTSSGVTFWLIPARRKNDRDGPGIMNCEKEGGASAGDSDDAVAEATSGCFPESAGSRSLPRANKLPLESVIANRTEQTKEGFTAGVPSEPARVHMDWESGRGRGSRQQMSQAWPGETQASPQFSVGQNTSSWPTSQDQSLKISEKEQKREDRCR